MERIKYQLNGLNVTIIKTDKFKTTDFILNFKQYLKPDKVTYRALVPYVLKSATKNYPSKKEISKKLEELYGASLGISVNKIGRLHIVSFRMSIVNDKYLMKNSSLLDDSFSFLHEVIFNPKIDNNRFTEKVINEEKRLLKEQFISLYDDKIRYGYHRLIEEMCKGENYAIKSIGRLEDVDNITPENLYDEYLDIINNDTVDLLVIGDIDENRIKSLIEKYFALPDREQIKDVIDTETRTINEVKEVIEVKEVSQAKLNIGFRTNTTGIDKDYYALMLLNAILGVYPNSLLFKNVREKESLCYYIASNIEKAKALMIIYAGINKNDYKKAYNIIIEQINKLKNGDFDENIIENCRKALINDLLQTTDNPIAFLSSEYSHSLYQEVYDIDNISDKLNQVTKENIIAVAKKIEEDTIYLLTSEEVSS